MEMHEAFGADSPIMQRLTPESRRKDELLESWALSYELHRSDDIKITNRSYS